jgi:tetratricopeptide (TPR) repeat protein
VAETLTRALEAYPDNPHLLLALGTARARLGEFDRAAECLVHARRAAPMTLGPLVRHAQALAEQGDWAAAKTELQRAAALEPWNPRPFLELACVHQRAAELDLAAQQAAAASRMSPDPVDARVVLAEIQRLRGQFEAAREAAEAAAGSPTSVRGWGALGTVLLALGRSREAVEWLRRALAANPGLHGAWASLRSLERLGQAVLTTLREAASQRPALAAAAAAAGPGPTTGTWAHYAQGIVDVVLVESAEGEVIAIVTEEGRPVEGRLVTLLEPDQRGVLAERGAGITDNRGMAIVGPAETLREFLVETRPGARTVRVTPLLGGE